MDMRRFNSILFFSILLNFLFQITSLKAQIGWVQQNSNTSINLTSISFINQNTGWAVGDSGIILKTINGGENWTQSRFGNYVFRAVTFINENTGIVVGGKVTFIGGYYYPQRLIVRTTNGGNNWQVIINVQDYLCYNVQFVNDSVGFIASSGLLKTTNGGSNWFSIPGTTMDHVYFLNENTGFASDGDSPIIYKSTDGGLYWTLIYYTGLHNFGGGVFFNNINTGYVIGHSTIFKTTDSGISWLSLISEDYLFREAICFSDQDHGMVLSNNSFPDLNFIQSTSNGGSSWYINYSSTKLSSVFLINNATGWVVGDNGRILKTTTGGISFVNTNSTSNPKSICLYQNYPNPFNPTTNINFDIPDYSFVNLCIYDMNGRELNVLVNENLREGKYKAVWNGFNFTSGVYFCRIVVTNKNEKIVKTSKLLLIK